MLPVKTRSPILWLLCSFATMASGCGNKNSTGLDTLNKTGFPFKVGNEWVYKVTEDFKNDDLEIHEELRATWRVTKIESVLGHEAFRMETMHTFLEGPSQGQTATGLTWYAVENDTLLAVASQDIEGLAPLAQLHKLATVKQDEANSWNVRVLVFPLVLAKKWEFQVERFFFTKDEKSVEAIDKVSTSAGTFEAFRVVRSAENTSVHLRTTQWFSAIGMVKMEHEDVGIQTRTNEQGVVIGETRASSVKTMELQSFHLSSE